MGHTAPMKTPDNSDKARLKRIAHEAMNARDLLPQYGRRVLAEVKEIQPFAAGADDRRDMRALPWVSIDNDDSEDLDQITAAGETSAEGTRIFVGIADVDALVDLDGAIDAHAEYNTTSVYTAGQVFAMIPPRLCYDLTSLNEAEERPAMVVEMLIAPDGTIAEAEIYPALVRNQAKLAYDPVGAWLADEGPAPAALAKDEDLAENVRRQDGIAQQLREVRQEHGALELHTIEARPTFAGEQIAELAIDRKNRAKELIENLMIAANVVTANFMKARELPSLRRVVRVPKRWERIVEVAAAHGFELPTKPDPQSLGEFLKAERRRDPLRFPDLSLTVIKLLGSGEYVVEHPGEEPIGHFGLAERNYTHATAPNRRFPDLITQRLIKSALNGSAAPYDRNRLTELARHCTIKEDDAGKVERQVAKSAAALLLERRIGERFAALVTGAAQKGTWVRLLDPPVEGMLVRGREAVDVGDRIEVELVRTDVERGHIDFHRVSS